jgi:transposase
MLMKEPVFVRPLSDDKRKALKAGLRSPDAFILRRCQILLASANGCTAYQIARTFGCHDQTVRNVIAKFNEKGLKETLHKGSRRPHTIHAAFDEKRAQKLKKMLHNSPRSFGRHSSLWTLEMAAEVSFEEGLTEKRVSGETIRATLERMGMRWQRAKRWITSPDPEYERKKAAQPTDEDGLERPRELGRGLLGRVLVEQGGSSGPQQLLRGGEAPASHSAVGR